MITLDPKVPPGPLEMKWDRRRFSGQLVSPANKRRIKIIVVGTGLAGASAASTLGQLGYQVECFCFHDSPRRAHSIAAQGGINAAKNYQNDGDSVYRLFYDTVKGGDYRRDQVVALLTGSQGEPRAAMARIADNSHPDISLAKGDLTIFSSRTIPGNETDVGRMLNKLFERGAHRHYRNALVLLQHQQVFVAGDNRLRARRHRALQDGEIIGIAQVRWRLQRRRGDHFGYGHDCGEEMFGRFPAASDAVSQFVAMHHLRQFLVQAQRHRELHTPIFDGFKQT